MKNDNVTLIKNSQKGKRHTRNQSSTDIGYKSTANTVRNTQGLTG